MAGKNNTYNGSMYENRGENIGQEVMVALAIAIISLLLAGVVINKFSGISPNSDSYISGNGAGNGGYGDNGNSSGGGYAGDSAEDTEDYDDTEDYNDTSDDGEDYSEDTEYPDYGEDTEYSDDSTYGTSDEPYTDNSDMNISACLTINDYCERTSSDGSFRFAYPKYVFNGSDIDEESNYYDYYYEDENGKRTMEMKFYTADNEGDAVENAKELFENIRYTPNEILYKVEPKDEVNSDGMARGIVAGTYGYDDEDTCVYIIGANDGEKDYIMELYYPDSAPEYDYDDVNYIVDCVYRYCSFAGGTYKPRSHELFMKDDMGEKK